jgi:hypothetical protein
MRQPRPAPSAARNGSGHSAANAANAANAARASVATADIAALERSLSDDKVTFNDVARAWFRLCDEDLSAAQRERCERLYPALQSAFATPRGGIVTAYFCQNVRVAAALTDIHKAAELGESLPCAGRDDGAANRGRNAASSSAIHIECALGDPADAKARSILFRCLDLHYRAIEFLTPKPRKICMRMIMGVVTSLLGILDERRCSGREVCLEPHEVECLEGVIEQARGYYDRSAQRQAQIEYFMGMTAGLLLILGVLFAIATTTGGELGQNPLLYTPLAAGLGAFVSVLARMTRGQLLLSYESGKSIMRLLGLIRPLLGALFGAAVYVLLAGGLVTIEAPKPDAELFFYIGIAFISGFSERFAQDMVARAPGGGAGAAVPASALRPAADAGQQLADAQRAGLARL